MGIGSRRKKFSGLENRHKRNSEVRVGEWGKYLKRREKKFKSNQNVGNSGRGRRCSKKREVYREEATSEQRAKLRRFRKGTLFYTTRRSLRAWAGGPVETGKNGPQSAWKIEGNWGSATQREKDRNAGRNIKSRE